MFVGYPFRKKGLKLYDLKSQEIFISRDAVFYEYIFPFSIINIKELQKNGSRE